jgi:DNA polymerase-1
MAAPVLGLDLETTGLDPHQDRPRLLSLSTERDTYLADLFALPHALEALRPLFEAKTGPVLVGHNLKFDLAFLLKAGLWPEGRRLWCTGLAHQVIHAQARMPALKDLAPGLDKTLQTSDWSGPLSPEQLAYAALDAVVPLSLYGEQKKRARAMGLEKVLEVEHRALPAVAWMELRGVPFAPELWEEAAREAEREAEALRGELPFGVNWNSPSQVLAYLKGEGLDLPDTREDTLAGYREHPLVAKLLRYREAAKRVSTYGKEWAKHLNPATGRIHPSWQQVGAETGRMACRKPNLQQVPRDPALRRAFRPPEGKVLLKADFSQIELRIAAAIAKEGRMLQAFREGKDLHALTASLVLGKPLEEVGKEDRQLAKALNFGLLYGLGAEGLRRYALTAYGVKLTLEEAQRLREAFFRAYPALKRWHRSQPEGEVVVRTLLGRRRTTDRHTEKLNTPVQGTGADGLKMALALLWENRGLLWGAFPVLAVHDEVVLEAPEEGAKEYLETLTALMRRGMEEVLGGAVPVEVEGGIYRDWGATPWEEES